MIFAGLTGIQPKHLPSGMVEVPVRVDQVGDGIGPPRVGKRFGSSGGREDG